MMSAELPLADDAFTDVTIMLGGAEVARLLTLLSAAVVRLRLLGGRDAPEQAIERDLVEASVVLRGRLEAEGHRPSVLLVALDSLPVRHVERGIVREGFLLHRALELADVFQLLRTDAYELIVLCPVGFPSPAYLLQDLQAVAPGVPVVLLGAGMAEVTALMDAGADPDGYLDVDLSTREIGAYLRAIARRYEPAKLRLV
jgi:hypothetical protein